MKWLWVVLVVCSFCAPALARADEPSEDDRALAVKLGREGVALYNEQRFEDAYDRFSNAEALVHSPVFVLYIARIERKRGKWLTALKRFDAVLGEAFPPDAPDTWTRARQEAELERQRLADAIPQVTIDVGGTPPAKVSVWIDGTLDDDWRAGPLELDPGKHQLVAQLGEATARRTVNLTGGKNVEVTFQFETARAPVPSVAPPKPVPPTWQPDRGDAETTGQHIAGYVLLATGGLAGLAAIGTLIGSAVQNGELSDQCVDDRCPSALSGEVELLDNLNRASLGLGIASVVTLITGWIVLGTAPDERAEPNVSVTVGPRGVFASGVLRW
jgi:hypothetical protein